MGVLDHKIYRFSAAFVCKQKPQTFNLRYSHQYCGMLCMLISCWTGEVFFPILFQTQQCQSIGVAFIVIHIGRMKFPGIMLILIVLNTTVSLEIAQN